MGSNGGGVQVTGSSTHFIGFLFGNSQFAGKVSMTIRCVCFLKVRTNASTCIKELASNFICCIQLLGIKPVGASEGIYTGLGEKDQAFKQLQKAYDLDFARMGRNLLCTKTA